MSTHLQATEGHVFNPAQQEELERVKRLAPSKAAIVARAFSGKSRAAAVKAKCLECSSYQTPEVKHCQVTDCALWPYRPYQAKRGEA